MAPAGNSKKLVLVAMIFAVAMTFIDQTIVAIAVPDLSALALGGTSLLIVVSVVVETMKQIEAQLMMRNYEGFIR